MPEIPLPYYFLGACLCVSGSITGVLLLRLWPLRAWRFSTGAPIAVQADRLKTRDRFTIAAFYLLLLSLCWAYIEGMSNWYYSLDKTTLTMPYCRHFAISVLMSGIVDERFRVDGSTRYYDVADMAQVFSAVLRLSIVVLTLVVSYRKLRPAIEKVLASEQLPRQDVQPPSPQVVSLPIATQVGAPRGEGSPYRWRDYVSTSTCPQLHCGREVIDADRPPPPQD